LEFESGIIAQKLLGVKKVKMTLAINDFY